MKEWARRSRGYLIVLPLALIVAFGYPTYQAYTGNNGVAHRPVDIPKGEKRELGPLTVQFVSLSVKQPQSDPNSFSDSVPQGAVVVVAKFRARKNNQKKGDDMYCESTVENADGWKWKSQYLSKPYIPDNASNGCDGKYLNASFKNVVPKKGEWYDFYQGYYVPKNRVKSLTPTLGYYKDYPKYLRFTS